ncbi:unnamed protein product [Adineta ricciae]|uniref:EF-hand domain-containing protein n=1 Tax=Adineta ricciae TaxID=249248 RepID=A0A815IVQ8_ADIRI|nr:unnamed protein product [Adineta ricciae]CAF1370815.1 unnamed protein product [Adineta ricciae]
MATAVASSYSVGDLSQEGCRRTPQVYQSILPLRRERSMLDTEFLRSQKTNSVNSSGLPLRSSAFAGEKQYERKQISTQNRSAKSDEIFQLIERKLQTGIHGVRHLFRANDPNRAGKLSREGFRRVLGQLCGYINNEEFEKAAKMFRMGDRDATITFEEFVSYFPENEKVKHELAAFYSERQNSSLLTLSQNLPTSQSKRFLPRLTASYCYSLMKARCRDPSFVPNDYFPNDCLNDGLIIRDHLKIILKNFHLDDIINNEKELEKLWAKFDLDNVGMVRTNVFLRLLDYGVNLADEINANIQRLATDRSTPYASAIIEGSYAKKKRPVTTNKRREENADDTQKKYTTPLPSDESEDETTVRSSVGPSSTNMSLKTLATKYRMLVLKHRRLVKQLNEGDDFIPFLDRKVNEGYYCLKTIFSYLDPDYTNFITKEQLIAVLHQFDIPLTFENVDQFLQKYHCKTAKNTNNETIIDYNAFLKYFQDRSDSSFLARAVGDLKKDKSKIPPSNLTEVEDSLIDLLHDTFLSLTAAMINYVSRDNGDLCTEKEFFLVLKKELGIADTYQFTDYQKDEIYNALNCTNDMRQKRHIPYKRFLYLIIKPTIVPQKERTTEKKPLEKKSAQKPMTPPRNLSYIEKTLYDLIRLRMHSFTKAFSNIDQPRTDRINKEQFYKVLQDVETDLTQSEANLVWAASGFRMDRSVPFANLIRQMVMFTHDEKHAAVKQLQRSQAAHGRLAYSAPRTASSRNIGSSGRLSELVCVNQSVDYRELYNRILPYIRQNYTRIKNDLLNNDPTACGLVDFSILRDILNQYAVPVSEDELGALVRLDDPRNGSRVQYPFFIRKYHPDGPVIRISPWLRVHPIYEQIVQKQYAKRPAKEVHDQRTQNSRDLKNLMRLFQSYDKSRKGYLTNDEYISLLHDNDVNLKKTDEDYYQVFSKYDRQLRDQFNYIDLFRTIIDTIMS